MMKTYLSLLAFTLIFVNSNAQITNSVYLDYSSLWHYHAAGWNGVFAYETYTTAYIDGDTSVNGQDYYKQFRYVHTITYSTPQNDAYMLYGPSLVREDASNNFVYYYNGSESLFLDNSSIASASIGDPFPAPGATCTVESMVNQTIGSQTVNHLYGAVNMPQAGIVEGIGYAGPTCALGVEGNEILVCYYRLGDSVCFASGFEPEDFPEPQYMSLGNEELNSFEIAVYPNPANEELIIDPIQQADVINWMCYNATGKLVARGEADKLTTVSVSDWTAGIYFLHLVNTQGSDTVRKIVIE